MPWFAVCTGLGGNVKLFFVAKTWHVALLQTCKRKIMLTWRHAILFHIIILNPTCPYAWGFNINHYWLFIIEYEHIRQLFYLRRNVTYMPVKLFRDLVYDMIILKPTCQTSLRRLIYLKYDVFKYSGNLSAPFFNDTSGPVLDGRVWIKFILA